MDVMPKWAEVVLVPLISLLLAAILSALVILGIGEDPVAAVKLMVSGALGSTYGWGYTLYYATNFMFTGLCVAIAFHARLFNIGGEGQAMLGGLGVALACLYIPWPHWSLALIGAGLVLATRCLEPEEAWSAIDGNTLVLIFGMLAFGVGLDNAGTVELIVATLEPVFANAAPLLLLIAIYGLTSLLTESVTNNAVAVLLAPIAAGVAIQLGLDPRPFVVAVMFGASASFATPIGYQTNTLVYNAGGYKFTDFLKVGVPMNIIIGSATVVLIPLIWPLMP